ncbi:N-acetylmuramidase domain-containing protein [Methylobacillus glycogenes]|uniref:N-acetylmuramidase domain-containing protein n=1 Tax=Methylobacillus glycogenes TaxID=406 RepID=UPI001900F152|nr:N-acetylmuramidase domain-containing protein [Methylobacillus glycogenes]
MEILRLGSRGDLVKQLEHLLVIEGYPLKQDALFDQETEGAVRNYQTRMGLVADGLAGPKTISTLLARSKNPKYLTMAEITAGAKLLGVEVEAILAINEVESRGVGFLPDGRPVILYERHIMYRQLAARDFNLMRSPG